MRVFFWKCFLLCSVTLMRRMHVMLVAMEVWWQMHTSMLWKLEDWRQKLTIHTRALMANVNMILTRLQPRSPTSPTFQLMKIKLQLTWSSEALLLVRLRDSFFLSSPSYLGYRHLAVKEFVWILSFSAKLEIRKRISLIDSCCALMYLSGWAPSLILVIGQGIVSCFWVDCLWMMYTYIPMFWWWVVSNTHALFSLVVGCSRYKCRVHANVYCWSVMPSLLQQAQFGPWCSAGWIWGSWFCSSSSFIQAILDHQEFMGLIVGRPWLLQNLSWPWWMWPQHHGVFSCRCWRHHWDRIGNIQNLGLLESGWRYYHLSLGVERCSKGCLYLDVKKSIKTVKKTKHQFRKLMDRQFMQFLVWSLTACNKF